MKCRVIEDRETWSHFLRRFPAELRDIYFTWDYHALFQILGDGDPIAFFGESSSGLLLFYPSLRKSLPIELTGEPGFSDLASAYGYGGPLFYDPHDVGQALPSFSETFGPSSAGILSPPSIPPTPAHPQNTLSQTSLPMHFCAGPADPAPAVQLTNVQIEAIRNFEAYIAEWCQNNRIISEFIRFHPLLANQRFFSREVLVEENRTTVIVPTAQDYEQVRADEFDRKTRNLVKKAERAGLVFRPSDDWSGFQDRYLARMRAVGAGSYYAFSPAHFQALAGLGPERALLFDVGHEGRAVSSGVFLRAGPWMHYHLSAGTGAAKDLAPNDFLLSEAIRWACNHGVQRLHLGGGASTRPDDPLFHFKKGFSRQRGRFFTGKRRHAPDRHAALLARHQTLTGRPATRFQEYQEVP